MNLESFIRQFTKNRIIDEKDVFSSGGKFFLASHEVRRIMRIAKIEPFSVGASLGRKKGENFFPSITLLNMIKGCTTAKIWVNQKAEWLFVCGRDLFAEGIAKATGHKEKGGISLILNSYDEVLGFGKIKNKLSHEGIVVENILDIGDFVRRERKIRIIKKKY